MRTSLATLLSERRPRRRRRQPPVLALPRRGTARFAGLSGSALDGLGPRAASAASQSGFSLIEVLISTLLVSVIAIGTLTAFDTAGRASQDQRSHAQANQLAQQDEERLRSLTTTQLTEMASTTQAAQPEAENGLCVKEVSAHKWEYCSTTAFKGVSYTGPVFLVTSSSQFVSAAQNELSCLSSTSSTSYIQTTSSVRWESLKANRPAVTQSSIVTDPATGVLVKVFNQNHEPLEGVSVAVNNAKGTTPTFSSAQTTPAAGCVIATGITAPEAEVKVEKFNFVERVGKAPPVAKVKVVAGTTTPVEFVIAEAGAIEAEFVSEIGGVVTSTGVESDTFYAHQSEIKPIPEEFVQGTAGTLVKSETLKSLFPFAKPATPHEPENYTVFAGDCEVNNPHTANGSIALTANNEVPVKPGGTTKVKLEVPALNVTIDEGTTTGTPVLKTAESALLTNSGCAGKSAQVIGSVTYKRPVTISATTGVLQQKFQPYAKEMSLCVTGTVPSVSGKFFKNTFALSNTAKAGSTFTFALRGAGKVEGTAKQTCP
jgi:type IV pilus assembly protein PilV